MNFKKIGKYLIKLFISAVVSFIIISLICFFYYNIPVHYTNNEGYTDYILEKNKIQSRATEGYALGKTNNEGLNNYDDYTGQPIDILILGSSQFEAFNVMQNDNLTAQLSNMLGDDYSIYNLGVSGHDFLRCTQNLDKALEKYNPKKYVIMEVSDLCLSNKDINDALNNKIPELKSSENKFILTLEKIPALRCFYNQVDNTVHKNNTSSETPKYTDDISESLELLLNKISHSADKYGVQIIFLYHSPETAENDSISEQKQLWITLCDKNNINFIDMTEDFSNALNNNEYVYGFLNTLPNFGHLNKTGHKIIAEKISKFIITGE